MTEINHENMETILKAVETRTGRKLTKEEEEVLLNAIEGFIRLFPFMLVAEAGKYFLGETQKIHDALIAAETGE